jgi:hypothetical protein
VPVHVKVAVRFQRTGFAPHAGNVPPQQEISEDRTVKRSELIGRVVELAMAIRNQGKAEWLKRHPEGPVALSSIDPAPPSPDKTLLRELLLGLPAAEIYVLTLIMYVGRGDFSAEDLLAKYEQLSDTFKKPDWAVRQMVGKLPLAQYMAKGLERLSDAGIDVDNLF